MAREYAAWLIWEATKRCPLSCEYCFDNFHRDKGAVKPIEIPALIKTLNQTGKRFKITFTGGGEPFLVPNLVDACIALTKRGHTLGFNTNLIMPQVKRLAEEVDPDAVEYILASLHIKELERKGLLETYIEHYQLLKRKGFLVIASEVGYPPLVPEVENYKRFFAEHGIELRFDPFIGTYDGKTYPQAYTDKELAAFAIAKKSIKIKNQRQELCNAGYNAAYVDASGQVSICGMIPRKLGSVYSGFSFQSHLLKCPMQTCECPINLNDESLFALAKSSGISARSYVIESTLAQLMHVPSLRRVMKRLAGR